MAQAVYVLSAVTCLICAALLFRSYLATRLRLMMWSSICFSGLAITNIILIVDLIFIPEVDLSLLRLVIADISLGALALGLAWESR